MKKIYKNIKILILISCYFNLMLTQSEDISKLNRKNQLKEIITLNANKVFLSRSVSTWPQNKDLINLWKNILDEVGDYIKKSGSSTYSIFNKYFAMSKYSKEEIQKNTPDKLKDISTEIFYEIELLNKFPQEERSKKLENLLFTIKTVLDHTKKEVSKVKPWRQATTDAKEVFLYLIDIFAKIYKYIEKNQNSLLQQIEVEEKSLPSDPTQTSKVIPTGIKENQLLELKSAIENNNAQIITHK